MISTVSYHVSQQVKDVVNIHKVNRVIEIEKVHIHKDVITMNRLNVEQINYTYQIQNRNIYQTVNNIGNNLNVTA